MLHNIPYLTITKKTKVYGYRRRIPEDVRFLFDGKREIVKSLKTKNLSLAQINRSQWNDWYEKRVATFGYTRKQNEQLPAKLVKEIHDDLRKTGQHPEDVPTLGIRSNLVELEQFHADTVAIKVTCAPKTPPDLCRVRPTKGRTHEGTIYGRTDHSDDQGTGIW